ncbi:MAG TPA: efflux RND transporter periplasmic adaptor subunit [Steroidobacteraceae bacterium]|jgi:membrane fusion protein (multidrug efflux system)|nr:efflux RND transporter periplasmic adaptor subunit [Steroidobacteraceae bacterium]
MPKENSSAPARRVGWRAVTTLAAAATLVLAACGKEQGGPPPPPEVSVITLKPRPVAITDQLPGRTTAFRVAEVRPQVTGIVQKRLFAEGTEVKAGQQLFQIDPGSYRAALSSAEAALKRAEAQAVTAKLLAERYEPLIAANAVSKQENDEAIAARARAEADVASARAAVEAARINLVYTQVLAPISGQIGRTLVTEGALVTSGQQGALATVQQLDPIYVDIAQSSTEILRLQRQLANGELVKDEKNQAEVTLTLEDGSVYAERGRLKVSEAQVDPSTGSVVLRAVFPNPRRELLPGMFVRAQLAQGTRAAALLVPQRGVSHNPKGEATVLIVDKDDKVQERVVTADRAIQGEWLITAGLDAGDRVIVDGLQKAKPGAPVKPVPAAEELVSTGSGGGELQAGAASDLARR